MPGNVYKILRIFHVHNFLYVNSSSISWATQGSERLSDAHRHTVSSVRPGIHLKPAWLQRLYVLFPLYQRFPTQLFIRIKGEQCKYKFLGPTPDLLNQNLRGGVCLGIYFKSSQGQSDNQPGVGILYCIHSTRSVFQWTRVRWLKEVLVR